MKYTVVTTSTADDQLARLWMQAPDRQAVSDAFNRIESLLKHDAHLQGRRHPNGWRVLTESPIVISFEVSEDDRLARVLSVGYRK